MSAEHICKCVGGNRVLGITNGGCGDVLCHARPVTWRDNAVEHVDALHAIACDTSAGLTIAEHHGLVSATRQLRSWLGDDGITRRDSADAIATRLAARDAEVGRLRKLVKSAYMEGRRCFWDPDNAPKNWRDSDARKALGGEA